MTSRALSSSDTIGTEIDSCRKYRSMEDAGFLEQQTFFLQPPTPHQASPSSQMLIEKHLQRTQMTYQQLPWGFKPISRDGVS